MMDSRAFLDQVYPFKEVVMPAKAGIHEYYGPPLARG